MDPKSELSRLWRRTRKSKETSVRRGGFVRQWWFALGANGQLYPRLALLLLRSSHNCLRPGLAIIVVSPGVLHLQHTSEDADCIDRIKTLAEIINSHAKRVTSRKATQRRTWAAAMERPFSCEVGHASGGA